MQPAVQQCPFHKADMAPETPVPNDGTQKHYTVTGGPKGIPVFGPLFQALRNPLAFLMGNGMQYGDIIPYRMGGMNILQVNHPDLVRYVVMENHKNYHKSAAYIRFEPVLGKGLLTSNGDKWRRDRQKIQPMFKREEVESGYFFQIVNEVSEKYKRRWLELTAKGPAELNITSEMAFITIEVILKSIFGKDNLDEATQRSLHHSYGVFIEYMNELRIFPRIDMRKVFRTPGYRRFKKELDSVEAIIAELTRKYRNAPAPDKNNMLALLIEAQKADPEHFSETDIRDHSISMVFAGYETTSILMQWMWYALDTNPDAVRKLRADIAQHIPVAAGGDTSALTIEGVNRATYLTAVFKETLRMYPSFWANSRENIADDYFGDYKVPKGTTVILPQIVMHRHPKWWNYPNAFMPERFMGENENSISEGMYFPFSHGPRKCSGFKLVEMEAKTIFAKLLPLFNVTAVNAVGNPMEGNISLKLQQGLRAVITRA